ncbi:MAG: PLDc N-terminal domain-containing protein [Halioglobus sp.]|nr:PLDc N-terminal domain-containing protein [Halioglobus sp.]MCB1686790.1 PLDc N-terminal domain-containing protein [Pseudomonadales bacterium]
MDIQVTGFFGLLVLIADIWAILNIVQSPSTTGKKLLWILIILLLPLIGVIIWWLAGPREKRG